MGPAVKARLDELTAKARQVTADVLAACDGGSEDTKLASVVHDAKMVEACFSGYLADLRKCIGKPEADGSCCFKLHNVPHWPAARLKAWLARNKLAVTVWHSAVAPCELQAPEAGAGASSRRSSTRLCICRTLRRSLRGHMPYLLCHKRQQTH